jgi:hypothetical protein
MDIPQSWIGGRLPGTPGGGVAGTGRLVPDDLAAHEKTDVNHVTGNKGMQGNIGLTTQIGYIDTGTAARDKNTPSLFPNPLQESQVLRETEIFVIFLTNIVRRRSNHEVNAGIRQQIHALRRSVDNRIDYTHRKVILQIRGWLDLWLTVI